jgi:hypothetical protein
MEVRKKLLRLGARLSNQNAGFTARENRGAGPLPYMGDLVLIKHIDSKQFGIDTYQ